MSAVTKEKICVDCAKPYQPTSNVQKRCDACRAAHKPAKKVAGGKDMSSKKKKKLTPGKTDKKLPTTGKAQGGEEITGNAIVFIDYSRYPKLMKRLEVLSVIDEDLLEVVVTESIHKHLEQLEARL